MANKFIIHILNDSKISFIYTQIVTATPSLFGLNFFVPRLPLLEHLRADHLVEQVADVEVLVVLDDQLGADLALEELDDCVLVRLLVL